MQNKLIIGGIVASSLGLIGGFYYQSYRAKKLLETEKHITPLERDLVVLILKEMQNQFFAKFQNIALMALNIKEQFRGQIAPAELREVISQKSNIFVDVAEIESRLYKQHNITQKQFECACKIQYKSDDEIQILQKDMKNEFENASIGVQPDSRCTLPDFLTEEKTLEILGEIMKQSALQIRDAFVELKRQGEVLDFNNQKVLQQLNSLKMDDIKKEILDNFGLNNLKEPGTKILSFATQSYSRSNSKNFIEKMRAIEAVHQGIIQTIFADPEINPQQIVEQFQAAFEKFSQ